MFFENKAARFCKLREKWSIGLICNMCAQYSVYWLASKLSSKVNISMLIKWLRKDVSAHIDRFGTYIIVSMTFCTCKGQSQWKLNAC